jgi:hypothetical protein
MLEADQAFLGQLHRQRQLLALECDLDLGRAVIVRRCACAGGPPRADREAGGASPSGRRWITNAEGQGEWHVSNEC